MLILYGKVPYTKVDNTGSTLSKMGWKPIYLRKHTVRQFLWELLKRLFTYLFTYLLREFKYFYFSNLSKSRWSMTLHDENKTSKNNNETYFDFVCNLGNNISTVTMATARKQGFFCNDFQSRSDVSMPFYSRMAFYWHRQTRLRPFKRVQLRFLALTGSVLSGVIKKRKKII